MMDAPPPSFPSEDLAWLLERARAEIAWTQELIETARAIQADTVSLCVESAMLVDEVRFRQSARR
jgi:hypothetical protein